MKKRIGILLFILTFIIEIVLCTILFNSIKSVKIDTVKVNECKKSIEDNYNDINKYNTSLEYTVIDNEDNIVYKTSKSKTNSINESIMNNDIMVDIIVDNKNVGKLLINNNTNQLIKKYKSYILYLLITMSIIQFSMILIYTLYLNKTIIKPFKDLNKFASRVAEGNLDIPLYMDKRHTFGEFTEAFDLMRSELKKARINEKKANDTKKEMVAKLSHDIKTPVASIKSTSEIGYEVSNDDNIKKYFNLINVKTDQIKLLVDNLFNSSINEITEIDVNPYNYNSNILNELIKNADYLGKLNTFNIPTCTIFIDKVRMQQVFDNIFNNSYKYANTKVDIDIKSDNDYLIISIRDYGNGVNELDIPFLKEKYRRGSDVKDKDGAGLGLHLSDYFMEKMNGKLEISNDEPGFRVTIYIRII